VEYGALSAFSGICNLLPLRLALCLAWGVAWLTHRVFGFRAVEARRRIRFVLGEASCSEADARRIAWLSWRNLCFTVVDLMRVPKLTYEEAQHRMVNLDAVARLEEAAEGRGVVLAVPHLGGWDVAGIIAHLRGVPMFFIARRQKNPLVDDFLNRLRGTTGVDTVLNDSRVLQGVIRRLKKGKVLAILPDVRAPTESLAIHFLGGTANIGAGMAMFARSAGVPIQVACVTRVGWTQHQWAFNERVFPDPEMDKREDWLRMTQTVMRSLEALIRRYPEHYFWYNKRWVLDPLPPASHDE
jgi:KDO2-lipid IV(A) lauroyltransferase